MAFLPKIRTGLTDHRPEQLRWRLPRPVIFHNKKISQLYFKIYPKNNHCQEYHLKIDWSGWIVMINRGVFYWNRMKVSPAKPLWQVQTKVIGRKKRSSCLPPWFHPLQHRLGTSGQLLLTNQKRPKTYYIVDKWTLIIALKNILELKYPLDFNLTII